ncbi:MAG: hypothetical protein SFU25_05080 [Candidatus Caenarcaniphilales bacterium]|nr:hypothetical protein [Candidatus Caenarcaniphilales bacterium]
MQVFNKLKEIIKSTTRTDCPKCDSAPANSLRLIWPEDAFSEKLFKIKTLRNGDGLYKCPSCKTSWVKQDAHLTLVKNLDLISRWNQKSQICKPEILEDLKKIGQTNFLSFPCSCELKSGKQLPKCVISFVDEPPLWFTPEQKIIFIDEVKAVAPSTAAIPQAIRQKLSELWELTLGTKAVYVKDKNGKFYSINGIKNFFTVDESNGEDLEEVVDLPEGAEVQPYESPDSEIVTVLTDLEPHLMEM